MLYRFPFDGYTHLSCHAHLLYCNLLDAGYALKLELWYVCTYYAISMMLSGLFVSVQAVPHPLLFV